MSFTNKKFYFLILFFFHSSFAFGNEKLTFIDIDSIINETNAGKKILTNLQQLNKKNLSKLKNNEAKIKKLEEDINKQKNVISEEDLKVKIVNLRKEINAFQSKKEQLNSEFKKTRQDELNKFLKKITPLIEEYMKKNNISFILNKKDIFIASQKNNITKDIIGIINKKIK